MHAAVIDGYGSPDKLVLREIERPKPGPGEVLVRVRASSVNPVDCYIRQGGMRMMVRLGLPAPLGIDFAGEIAEVGEGIGGFAEGDEVFGWKHVRASGTWAEYTTVDAQWLGSKPPNLTMREAGVMGGTAVTALQGLVNEGGLTAGMHVLVVGASGGVGTMAVQIAKALGARVTAVCGASTVEMVSRLGADRVIDYRAEDVGRIEARFDIVLDCVGQRSYWQWRRLLAPKGRHVVVPASPRHMLASVLSRLDIGRRSRFFFADPRREDLETIGRLVADGELRPVIDRTYALTEIAQGNRYVETGHAHGKIAIEIG